MKAKNSTHMGRVRNHVTRDALYLKYWTRLAQLEASTALKPLAV